MKNVKVLISAPLDQDDEVNAVLTEISNFNELMAKRNVHFTAVHWKKNMTTGRSERGQDVINDQIRDCDMIIAIVGTRMGTETGKADSGTAEEVFDFCKRNGFKGTSYNTHIFFNTFYDGDVLGLDAAQLLKVQKFKSEISELGILYAPFSNYSTLKNLTNHALDMYFFQSEKTQTVALQETEKEELGLEEYLNNTSENFSIITGLINEIASDMTQFSNEITEISQETDEKKLVSRGADAMDRLADNISDKVNNSQNTLDLAYTNLNGGLKIAIEDFLNDENVEELDSLIIVLKGLVSSGRKGQDGIQALEDQIKSIPRKNKKIIKSRNKTLRPIMTLNQSLSDFNNNVEILSNEVSSAISFYKAS